MLKIVYAAPVVTGALPQASLGPACRAFCPLSDDQSGNIVVQLVFSNNMPLNSDHTNEDIAYIKPLVCLQK